MPAPKRDPKPSTKPSTKPEPACPEPARSETEEDAAKAALMRHAAGIYCRLHLTTSARPAECALALRETLEMLDAAILGTAALKVASRAGRA